ncbi:MAG: hypothetical protein ACRDU8_02490 [Egibacteraceae bacterium]
MHLVRNVLSRGCAGVGKSLAAASQVLEAGAEILRPRHEEPIESVRIVEPPPEPAVAPQPRPTPTMPGEPTPPVADEPTPTVAGEPTPPVAGEPTPIVADEPTPTVADEPSIVDEPHVRTAETHVAAIAERNASEVIEAIPTLSTDELRDLVEYEAAHRNRKTVLRAIEQAVAP